MRLDCPFCPWFVDGQVTVTDPAPGGTIAETHERRLAARREEMAAGARRQLAEHLDLEHPDRALPAA